MHFNIHYAIVAFIAALKAIPTTILVAFVPFIIGILGGTLLAIARILKLRVFGRLAQIYVVIVKGIPSILIILMVYFFINTTFDMFAIKLQLSLRSKDINPLISIFIALSISSIAGISEVIRGAILSVNEGQFEAAYSIGLTRRQTLRRIILPQAFPAAVPLLCSAFIGLVKSSALAFLVTVTDLLNAALLTANGNYAFLEAYVSAAIIYWILNVIIEKIFYHLENSIGAHLKGGVM